MTKTPPVLDLRPILAAAHAAVASARLAPGIYNRWLDDRRHASPATGNDPYGCSDAANILYSLNEFPGDPAERSQSIAVLLAMQNPDTGLFEDPTHHTFHVTAYCVAALELFDARPLHPLTELLQYRNPGAIESFLDGLAWKTDPWGASLQGAGVFAALAITDEGDLAWRDRYFAWLRQEADPATGLWRRGAARFDREPDGKPIFHHVAGSFHYLFNHEWAHEPLPYPAALVDTCLRIWHEGHLNTVGGGFAVMDFAYCLTRAERQCGHRFAEAQTVLESLATQFVTALQDQVTTREVPFEDLHGLFGLLCGLAELQAALPGRLRSDRPLRLVLDRRPFI